MLSTMDLEEHEQAAQSMLQNNNSSHEQVEIDDMVESPQHPLKTSPVEEPMIQEPITNEPQQDEHQDVQPNIEAQPEPTSPDVTSPPHDEQPHNPDQRTLQSPLVREQLKFCTNLLKGLKRHPQSPPFQVPVDPVALGIPDYPTIIKHPMDLSTISKKLETNEYETAQGFIDDVRLMLTNCFTYNAPETQVHAMGKALEKYFENTLTQMPTELTMAAAASSTSNISGSETPKRRKSDVLSSSFASSINRPKRESITPKRSSTSTPLSHAGASSGMKRGNTELTFCGNVLKELYKKAHAHLTWPFLEPVDPIRLGIPDYFDVIKTPMDMSTIRKKLESGQYVTADQFEADFRLMLTNCFTYNAPDSDVVQLGRSLEAVFDKKWAQRSSFTAAKASNGGSASHHNSHHQNHHYDDDDDSDSEKILALNRKIQALQQELNELLMKRKRRGAGGSSSSGTGNNHNYQHHHHHHHQSAPSSSSSSNKPSSSAAPTKPRTPKTPSANAQFMNTPMTFEEKRQLSIDVNNLTPERLGRVVEIIHASMPNLKQDADSEVIELDIESLDVRTLRELQKYVHECKIAAGLLPPGAPLPGSGLAKKRKASSASASATSKKTADMMAGVASGMQSSGSVPQTHGHHNHQPHHDSSHPHNAPAASACALAAPNVGGGGASTDDSGSSCSDDDLA